MSSSKRKKKTSDTWKHFNKTNIPKLFKCVYCNAVITFSGSSIGNLNRHLKMKHPSLFVDKVTENTSMNNIGGYAVSTEHNEEVTAVLGIDYSTATAAANHNQGSEIAHAQNLQYIILQPADENQNMEIKSTNENQSMEIKSTNEIKIMEIKSTNENKSIEINNQVLKTIVKELHPFTMVDNAEFKMLVSLLNPTYTLPSYNDLKNILLPEIYQVTIDMLKSTLMEVTAVALTTDRWTSINNERYISVTVHYLDQNFELKSSFLGCTSFPEKHSSNDIAMYLQNIAAEWQLLDRVVAVVTDHVPSMINAVKECKWQHVSCFASILNKIVNVGLAEIKPIIQNIRHIIGYFKRNKDAMQTVLHFQNEMGLNDLKLKIDVPSRWNSTFEMIARFSKNKEALQSAVKELQLNFELSSSDWVVIEKSIKVLIIFNSVAVEISAENTLSLSKVPHMVTFMVKYLSDILAQKEMPKEVVNMATIFKDELRRYSKELELNAAVGQNVLLDPRFKKRGFPENTFNDTYAYLCNDIISLKMDMKNEKPQNQSEVKKNAVESEYVIDIWCEFKDKEPEPKNNASEAAIAEIRSFMNDEFLSLSDNPLKYWGNVLNQNKFPTVFELVKRRVCIPATAIPGHRFFTKHGNNFLEKRKSLTSEKLNEILFLNHNL